MPTNQAPYWLAAITVFAGLSTPEADACRVVTVLAESCKVLLHLTSGDTTIMSPVYGKGADSEVILAWKVPVRQPDGTTLQRILAGWKRTSGDNWEALPPLSVKRAVSALRVVVTGAMVHALWGQVDLDGEAQSTSQATSIVRSTLTAGRWSEPTPIYRAPEQTTLLWIKRAVSDPLTTTSGLTLIAVPQPGGSSTSRIVLLIADARGVWTSRMVDVTGVAYSALARTDRRLLLGYIGAIPGPAGDRNSVSIRSSDDDGATWSRPRVLHQAGVDEPAYDLELAAEGNSVVHGMWRQRVPSINAMRLAHWLYAPASSDSLLREPDLLGGEESRSSSLMVTPGNQPLLLSAPTSPSESSSLLLSGYRDGAWRKGGAVKYEGAVLEYRLVSTASGESAILATVMTRHPDRPPVFDLLWTRLKPVSLSTSLPED